MGERTGISQGFARIWQDVVMVRPAEGTAWVAGRAGTSILGPLLLLAVMGHLDWALYASFGTFSGVYGGRVLSAGRWRVQAAMGMLLTAAVLCGVLVALSPDRRWLAIPVAAIWAAVAAALSDAFHWRPHGPLFPVFAVAACSAVPSSPTHLVAAFVVSGGAAVFAISLGAAEVAWASYRASYRRPTRGQPAGGDPPLVVHPMRRRIIQAGRCAAAVCVAGVAATAAGVGHPYWAMVAAVVPMAGHTYREQLARGILRLGGTFAGLAVAAALLGLRMPVAVSILVVVLLQGAAEALITRNYGLALMAITPLALLLGHLADPSPVWPLIGDRAAETGIGVVVGLIAVSITREGTGPGTS